MPYSTFQYRFRPSKVGFKLFLGTLTVMLMATMGAMGSAAETSEVPALFPVQLEHPFPQPRETFEAVKTLMLQHYYCDDVSEEVLYWAAIEGMLRHLSPPKTPDLGKIWTATEYEKILESLQGVQTSLGFSSNFNAQDGSLTVVEVQPGSPAESVLQPRDRILRINSQPLKGKHLEEINALINGGEDVSVDFTVNRDIRIFDLTLTRRQFETTDLVVSRLSDILALVRIGKFSTHISQTLKTELDQLQTAGYGNLIIDLRNNSGGVFIEALRSAELFLPDKRILLRTRQRDTRLQNYISSNSTPYDFKLAVLVNRKSASAAEILTAALQDSQRALILGTRTFGKGVFEKTFEVQNGLRVKFITGAMYSPKGKAWQSSGITPDFLVEQDEKTLKALLRLPPKEQLKKDVALITAVKLLMR